MFERAPDGTAFELFGDKDAPPIVLIHGLGLCRQLWRDHLPEFLNQFRVLSYDLYGHGDSAPASQTLSLTVFAKQLSDLMDYLAIKKVSVIGFSIGDRKSVV